MNKKLKNGNFKLSVRLYDEKFNVIFGLTKKDYKDGLVEIAKMLELKFDEDLNKIIKKRAKK